MALGKSSYIEDGDDVDDGDDGGARGDGGGEPGYTPDNSVQDGVSEAVEGGVGGDCSEHTTMGDGGTGTIFVIVWGLRRAVAMMMIYCHDPRRVILQSHGRFGGVTLTLSTVCRRSARLLRWCKRKDFLQSISLVLTDLFILTQTTLRPQLAVNARARWMCIAVV